MYLPRACLWYNDRMRWPPSAKMNGFTISVLDLIQSQLEIGSAVSADLSPDQCTLYVPYYSMYYYTCIVFLLHSFNFW